MTNDSSSDDSWLRGVARAPSVAPADLVGQTLGRYRVGAVLGRGGMGIVYLADDTSLGRKVALKVLGSGDLRDDERRRRFVREAKLAAAISSPHVATVHDVGELDDRVYLAMEYVPGETLRARLARGPMTIPEVMRVALAIARGVAAAHAAAVVHRDIKPENVVVGEGVVKVLDFGAAKLRASSLDSPPIAADLVTETKEGRLIGTPAYMSPEQAKGTTVDARSDVFSIGATVYEMTTGVRPFVGATTLDLLIAIDRDEPAPVLDLRPDAPSALVAVVNRCLKKDPAARFESAAGIVEALTAPQPRSRRTLGLAAAGLVALAGGYASSRWYQDGTVDERRPLLAAAAPSLVAEAVPSGTSQPTDSAPIVPVRWVAPASSSGVQTRPRVVAPAVDAGVKTVPGPLEEPK